LPHPWPWEAFSCLDPPLGMGAFDSLDVCPGAKAGSSPALGPYDRRPCFVGQTIGEARLDSVPSVRSSFSPGFPGCPFLHEGIAVVTLAGACPPLHAFSAIKSPVFTPQIDSNGSLIVILVCFRHRSHDHFLPCKSLPPAGPGQRGGLPLFWQVFRIWRVADGTPWTEQDWGRVL
jgi:hypothetical protein